METGGVLLNAAISLTGGVAYLVLAARCTSAGPERARWLFCTLVGIHLALAGVRQGIALAAISPTSAAHALPIDLVAADLAFFRVTTLVGALTAIPLAYAACQLVAPRHTRLVGVVLGALALSGLAAFFLADVTGPHLSEWGSDWEIQGPLTRAVVALALGLPATTAIVVHLRARGPTMHRERALGVAALLYYVAIVPDALGMTGVLFILARLVAVSSVVVAWDAFVRLPPKSERVPA